MRLPPVALMKPTSSRLARVRKPVHQVRAVGAGQNVVLLLADLALPVADRSTPITNRAEYEPEDVPKATARRAVHQAERLVQIARQVVVSARSWTLHRERPVAGVRRHAQHG